MIPKTIYFTWISDKPIPRKFHKYIESWKRVMPGYKIKQITLENVVRSPFVQKALAAKNYVLAGHYGRLWEVYCHGGIYFDVDIEAVKSFDPLLKNKMFVAQEDADWVNNAVFGAVNQHEFVSDCLDYLNEFDFSTPQIELETGPRMFTKMFERYDGDDITLYPPEYFYPYHYTEEFSKKCIKPNTYAIHHWAHSWNTNISVVIPCYNQGEYLADAIDSVLRQHKPAAEIIGVNDGSTDNTSTVARKYGKAVKLIEQKNKGLPAARNAGIEAAASGLILTLDADDKIEPTFLSRTVGLDDIVSTALMTFGDYSQSWSPPLKHPTYDDFKTNNQINCCAVFSKSMWEEIGGYDEAMTDGYEDWDFWLRATNAGYTVTTIDEPLLLYRRHGKTMVHGARLKHKQIYEYMMAKDARK